MASRTFMLLVLVASLAMVEMAMAGDPDILTDFIVPANANASLLNGTFFTFTGLRALLGAPPPTQFNVIKATVEQFPALDGLSVSYAVLNFPPNSTNPPHIHPRGSELLFAVEGSLEVGFVDTTNKLFTQTLQAGDMFVFPKGLVHFQYNPDPNVPAFAVSSFGSCSAGTISVPVSVFGTHIDANILAKSFKTDVATILKLQAGLTPPS